MSLKYNVNPVKPTASRFDRKCNFLGIKVFFTPFDEIFIAISLFSLDIDSLNQDQVEYYKCGCAESLCCQIPLSH